MRTFTKPCYFCRKTEEDSGEELVPFLPHDKSISAEIYGYPGKIHSLSSWELLESRWWAHKECFNKAYQQKKEQVENEKKQTLLAKKKVEQWKKEAIVELRNFMNNPNPSSGEINEIERAYYFCRGDIVDAALHTVLGNGSKSKLMDHIKKRRKKNSSFR